ncbi:MAG: hypothetical protein ACE5FN_03860 [Leptospirillia bacterium]
MRDTLPTPFRRTVLAACAAALSLTGCAELDHALAPHFGEVVVRNGDSHITIAFSDGDRRAIHDYYAARHEASAKRGRGHGHNPHGDLSELPPGIRKQIARGKGLPPGLARQHLPTTLEDRLSPLPDGYVRLVLGTDVVIFDTRAEVVLDLMTDI